MDLCGQFTPILMEPVPYTFVSVNNGMKTKKHLKNVGPIRNCEPPHCHSPGVATVARRLRIDVHNNNDNNDNA